MVGNIALYTFAAVFALFMAIYLLYASRRSRVQDALRKRLGAAESESSLLKSDAEMSQGSSMARIVAESGLGWTMSRFFTLTAGVTVVCIFLGLILRSSGLAFVLGLLGLALVPGWAIHSRNKRLLQCDQQMPQALEIMSLALRAGHPLPTALAIAAAEAPSPIADELRRAVEENELGRSVGDVLINMGKRLPSSEAVHTFVVAVLVLQQTGGNLISVIDRIVDNARSRAQYRAKLRALTSEGKSSARMLGLMPLAFGVLAGLVDPTYAGTLFTTFSGNMILVVAGILWILGLLWTFRLTRTEA